MERWRGSRVGSSAFDNHWGHGGTCSTLSWQSSDFVGVSRAQQTVN